jgi:L-seryl-tRNA(Ser) seleniumtransferase
MPTNHDRDKPRTQPLSRLPKVQAVLDGPEVVDLLSRRPRWAVVQAVRDELTELRRQLQAGAISAATDKLAVSTAALDRRVTALLASPLRRVINATGVVLHTNLGRAPLAVEALRRVGELAGGYCNLEYQLDSGTRGSRQQPLAQVLQGLTGAEAHLVVNNNAAAVLLALAGLCAGREVVVSRGELVEIGGSFRIPDVMRASGAALHEVGTTNRTHLRDYLSAIGEHTAALLKVHRSNFAQLGFVAEVPAAELARVAHERGLLCLYDLGAGGLLPLPRGSGAPPDSQDNPQEPERLDEELVSTAELAEPTVAEVVAQGCDVVMFSGDKLLGGPQAGILCGSAACIGKLAKHPLLRALRPDKLTLAALLATLELYRDGQAERVPTWQMLNLGDGELRQRAEALQAAAEKLGASTRLIRVRSAVGGGSQPLYKPWSWAVSPVLPSQRVLDVQAALRRLVTPVVARVASGRLLLDVRTMATGELTVVAEALATVLAVSTAAQ